MRREQLTETELQDWIVGRVRQQPTFSDFTTQLTFVRRPGFHLSGATWEIGSASGTLAWSVPCRRAFEVAVRRAQRTIDLVGWPHRVPHSHLTLAVPVGAAKDQAKALLRHFEADAQVADRCSAVFLALAVMQRQLLTVDPPPPPLGHFVPELVQLLRRCAGNLAPLQPLLEAALRVAREGEAEAGRDGTRSSAHGSTTLRA